ncbi:MAG: hypothetical protein VX498_09490 [Myxococcota bacterium]|nr:hypothetical protein [Myxococcota bacterium]
MLALLVLFILIGCGEGSSWDKSRPFSAGNSGPAASWCRGSEAEESLESLVSAAGLNTWRGEWTRERELGENRAGDGFVVRPVRWAHPRGKGEQASGLWFLPVPRPEGPLPLLVNVHGHWGAGVESDEVLFRSELFAREGWAVLSVATRGMELGGAPVPLWRASHFEPGLYSEMRERRTGRTPLAWNVEAALRGLDLAIEGDFGGGPIDRQALAAIGISGGSEIAALLAATEPRIQAVVLGSFEYAFGTQKGGASCSCGAVNGGGEVATASRWLALAGCRPGRSPRNRPVLAWDGQPSSGMAGPLAALGEPVVVRVLEEVHGFSHAMAAASWAFLEEQVRGRARSFEDEDRVRAGTAAAWLPLGPSTRMPWSAGRPSVGLAAQGAAPWAQPFSVRPEEARRQLGLGPAGRREDPGASWFGIRDPDAIRIHRAKGVPDGHGWVVVLGSGPEPEGEPLFRRETARFGDRSVEHLPSMAPRAAFAQVTPRPAVDPEKDSATTRWAIERGSAPLGLAVHDALEARDRLAALPEVDPKAVGFVGVGAGGPAALWAALLSGGDAPVVLSDAPVSLWWDGPRSGTPGPERPWPTWLLAAGPQGATLDPWHPASSLGKRVRWLSPRGGDGRPWTEAVSAPGRTYSSDEGIFHWTATEGP